MRNRAFLLLETAPAKAIEVSASIKQANRGAVQLMPWAASYDVIAVVEAEDLAGAAKDCYNHDCACFWCQ